MKSLKTLVKSLITEIGAECCTEVADDLREVDHRCEHEGEGFLTLALPAYCRSFERALDCGEIATGLFRGFSATKEPKRPRFLGGLLSLVFNDRGVVLPEPSIAAIQGVRQICLVVQKIFEVCSDERVDLAIKAYQEVENELESHDGQECPRDLHGELSRTASRIFGQQLADIDAACWADNLVPCHGPGATADRLLGNRKFDSAYWPRRLEKEFSFFNYAVCGFSHHRAMCRVEFVDPGSERPVRVIAVPKTAAKARIIAAEPANMQYMQQALLREFARHFRCDSPFVALDNQERNREACRRGSADRSLATLDLSEASDRLAVPVVEAVFARYPHLLRALLATRSQRAELPDGTILPLRKFASMGSATCFPVQSIVFATIALNAIAQRLTTPQWRAFQKEAPRMVTVFGDDIIVPVDNVHDVVSDLTALGLKVNPDKSFWTGKFRESCGEESYDGESVTIARLRRRLPESRRDSSGVLGLIAFRNQLYQLGYWSTVGLIDRWIRDLRIPMPIVEATSPVVGRESVAFGHEIHRYHPDYQSPLVRGLLVRTTIPKTESSDYGKLLKCLLPARREPFRDADHLVRSGRADRVATRVGWASPY